MTTNTRKVQKGIDSGFKAATPSQLAKYVSDEYCRIAQDRQNGDEVTTKRRDILNIIDTYVSNLKYSERTEYLMALHTHDTKAFVREYYYAQINNFHQQQCLLILLTRVTDRELMGEICKADKNCSDLQKESIKHLEWEMKMFQDSYDILQKRIDGILLDNFWIDNGILQPDNEPVIKPLSHYVL
jgi:hypothetical protein